MTSNTSAQASGIDVPSAGPTGRADRVDRFREDVAALAVPDATSQRETYLLWGGIALILVGIVVVFAGYWGASGTANVPDQLPYMLSGGALGLALVIVGAVLVGRYSMARLFRFWLALLVAENRSQTDRIVDALGGDGSPARTVSAVATTVPGQ